MTSMLDMLYACHSLVSLDLSGWSTSCVAATYYAVVPSTEVLAGGDTEETVAKNR